MTFVVLMFVQKLSSLLQTRQEKLANMLSEELDHACGFVFRALP
jgi:hypothetical protein